MASVEIVSEGFTNIPMPNLLVEIYACPSMFIHNGTILLCGGYQNLQNCLQLEGGIWKQHSSTNNQRSFASAVTTNTATFLFGGVHSKGTYEYLAQGSSKWQTGKTKIPAGFYKGCAIAISHEEIWLIGGESTERRILSFNIRSHSFEELPIKLNSARKVAKCALIPGTTKIIVTGGWNNVNYNLNSTEIIDIKNDSVVNAAVMNFKRSRHGIGFGVLTLDNEDKVAVFGGNDGNKYLNSVEAYNQKKQKWDLIDIKLKQPRNQFGFLSVNSDIMSQL